MWSSGLSAREARSRAARTRSWRAERSSASSPAYLEAPLESKVGSGWDFAARHFERRMERAVMRLLRDSIVVIFGGDLRIGSWFGM